MRDGDIEKEIEIYRERDRERDGEISLGTFIQLSMISEISFTCNRMSHTEIPGICKNGLSRFS